LMFDASRHDWADQLRSTDKVDACTSTKTYERPGDALDEPRRVEKVETILFPGVKWVRQTKNVNWRDN